jgi:aqualysin 1
VTLDSITPANWQSNPPNWGLDRIDRLLVFNEGEPIDERYNFDQTGQGVYVFLFDTGIRQGHAEFRNDPDAPSRVICGFDAFNFHNEPQDWNNGCYDGVGHGTHVAAIVGGSVYVRSC